MTKKRKLNPDCQHDPDPLSPPVSHDYVGWHDDADQRVAAGEGQRWCSVCERWIWEHLWRKPIMSLEAVEHYHWLRGIKDSIKVVQERSQFLRNLGPDARPAPGVIKILDEVALLLKAMSERGSYSGAETAMSPEPSKYPLRCQEKDEAGAQCLLMEGHQDIHRFRDDTAAVWKEEP